MSRSARRFRLRTSFAFRPASSTRVPRFERLEPRRVFAAPQLGPIDDHWLPDDGVKQLGPGVVPGYIYFADEDSDSIRRMNYDGTGVVVIVDQLDTPRGVAVDPIAGKLYWVDSRLNSGPPRVLQRANLDGSQIETLFGVDSTIGQFELDVVGRKIYLPYNNEDRRIVRMDLDGSNVETLVDDLAFLRNPMTVAVDHENERMLWINAGGNTGGPIWTYSANLAGGDIQTFAQIGGRDVELDAATHQVFLGDLTIDRFNLDGTGRVTIATPGPGFSQMAIDSTLQVIYWTDYLADDIKRIDFDGASLGPAFEPGLSLPREPATVPRTGLEFKLSDDDTPVDQLRIGIHSDNSRALPADRVLVSRNGAIGWLTLDPPDGAHGLAHITVTATDAAGLSSSRTFRVFVGPNRPPTLDAVGDLWLNQTGQSFVVGLAGITDGGGEGQPLRVTAVSRNPELIPAPVVEYVSGNREGTLTLDIPAGVEGRGEIAVTVTDGGIDGDLATEEDNSSFSRVFYVTIDSINDPPQFDPIGDVFLMEDAASTLVKVTGVSPGPLEQQPLRMTVSSSNSAVLPTPEVIYTSGESTGVLRLTPASDAWGTAVITVTLTDPGLDGDFDAAADNVAFSRAFAVQVSAVNDAPRRVAGLPPPLSLDEDQWNSAAQSLGFDQLHYVAGPSDENWQGLSYHLTQIPTMLRIFAADGATAVSVGQSLSDEQFRTLRYRTTPEAAGAGELKWEVRDSATTPGVLGESREIIVREINDVPIQQWNYEDWSTAPRNATTLEDQPLVFSALSGRRLTIFDVEKAQIGAVRVTLEAQGGTLSLPATTGLSFVVGDGLRDRTLVFTGSPINVNQRLNGLVFQPDPDWTGAAGFFLSTDDLAGGVDRDFVDIQITPVNDPPRNGVPTIQTVNEDQPLSFRSASGNSIRIDDDADDATIEATLIASRGTLDLAEIAGLESATGVGGSILVLTGRRDAINLSLQSLTFHGPRNEHGTATITVRTDDRGQAGTGPAFVDVDTITIVINSINDPPVQHTPAGTPEVDEDGRLTFSAGEWRIEDLDVGEGAVRVTLTAEHGTLTLSPLARAGLSFLEGAGVGDTQMSFSGSIAAVNAALSSLQFAPSPDWNGTARIAMLTTDQGGSGGWPESDEDVVEVHVRPQNDAPTLVVPARASVLEDQAWSMAGTESIRVRDDAGASPIVVRVAAATGAWRLGDSTGLESVDGEGTGSLVLRGAVDSLNAALATLVFSPQENFHGAVIVTATVDDQGASGGGPGLIAERGFTIDVLPVNDPPVVPHRELLEIDEDHGLRWSNEGESVLRIDDVDSGAATYKVQMSVNRGRMTLASRAGLSFIIPGGLGDGVDDSEMTFAGTRAAINAAWEGATFTPDADFAGEVQWSVMIEDPGPLGAAESAQNLQRTHASATIIVRAVNDPPVAGDDRFTVLRNSAAFLATTDNDRDVEDVREQLTVEVMTEPTHGAAWVSDGRLYYAPAANFLGTDWLTYVVVDRDGGRSTPAIATLDVRPDAPWYQNRWNRFDVNRDGFITPVDALLVINRLNQLSPGEPTLPPFDSEEPRLAWDVNGSDSIEPADALLVVERLNDGEAEGGPWLIDAVRECWQISNEAKVVRRSSLKERELVDEAFGAW
ncbi:MAG: Ig-like domain-containing protein [Pirellulales bacterium]